MNSFTPLPIGRLLHARAARPQHPCNHVIIRLSSIFEFGRGRNYIAPLAQSRLWKKLYWYLVAFGVLFYAALFWLGAHVESTLPK